MWRRLRGRLPDLAFQLAAEVTEHMRKPGTGTALPELEKAGTMRILDNSGWTFKISTEERVDTRSYVLRAEKRGTL
ncbi:hypothetical protein MRX96_002165 [Rhipicephalus microplus]